MEDVRHIAGAAIGRCNKEIPCPVDRNWIAATRTECRASRTHSAKRNTTRSPDSIETTSTTTTADGTATTEHIPKPCARPILIKIATIRVASFLTVQALGICKHRRLI